MGGSLEEMEETQDFGEEKKERSPSEKAQVLYGEADHVWFWP